MLRTLIKTEMVKRYSIKLLIRVFIFLSAFGLYLVNKQFIIEILTHKFTFGIANYGITLLHVVWLVFMVMMISHLFPNEKLSMALRKNAEKNYVEVPNYSQLDLMKFVQEENIKAWKIMLLWLSFNAIWGMLYLFGIMDTADLFMISVFYFLCDYICILFFCPFQNFIMKNKCCVNCRIYDWGHFMMFTPMLFIKNFYCWSLFFTSIVVLIHWEMLYARYPERFWYGSNQTLQCKNCKDKTCQWKKIGKVARSKKE